MEAYVLQSKTPSTVSPSSFLHSFRPLLRGQYPVFNQFPEFIINYQTRMKERIRKDEEDYLRKRYTFEILFLKENGRGNESINCLIIQR